jgi:hypothetical protein
MADESAQMKKLWDVDIDWKCELTSLVFAKVVWLRKLELIGVGFGVTTM